LATSTLYAKAGSREFLKKLGYPPQKQPETSAQTSVKEPEVRDLLTVDPAQTEVVQSKIESFKITKDWAKKEREKAEKQFNETFDESKKAKLKELILYYEQMELQATRRYNELIQNQFRRINEIINDKTRSLAERLKELFRRDGITIAAIITAVGMTISTISLSLFSGPPSTPVPGTPPTPQKPPNPLQRILVKISNLLLDLAKKSIMALPGAIGALISFLFKKAGEVVLFLSEHLMLLFIAVMLFIAEFIFSRLSGIKEK
jgi:hypothetical protein